MGAENKLEEAKKAAKMFVNGLQEDFLSVYSFSDVVRERVPAKTVSNKGKIKDAIDSIELEGGTALFKAMRQVRENLRRSKTSSLARRLIIITDGVPTSDEQLFSSDYDWKRHSEKFAVETLEKGISITAIGVGSDYNETILSALAAKSGGQFKHIRSANELSGFLQEQLRSLQKTVADNCVLHIVTTPGSECTIFSHRNVVPEGNDIKVKLGSLEEGTFEIAGEFAVDPKPPGTFRIAKGFVEYDEPTIGQAKAKTNQVNVIANPTDNLDLITKGRNSKVIEKVTTYRMAIDTLQSVKTGRASEITQRIEELTRRPDLNAQTRRELQTLLVEQQKTGRLDTKKLMSQTQRIMDGKQKEGDT